MRDFEERLRRNFTQDWFSHLSRSSHFEMYHCFKSASGREQYLDLIKVNIYRTALERFTLGVSPFKAHRLRYSLSEANRDCPFCTDKAEDKVHVIFECYVYENIRNVHFNKLQDISFQDQVFSMLKSTQKSKLVALGKILMFSSANASEKIKKCSTTRVVRLCLFASCCSFWSLCSPTTIMINLLIMQ